MINVGSMVATLTLGYKDFTKGIKMVTGETTKFEAGLVGLGKSGATMVKNLSARIFSLRTAFVGLAATMTVKKSLAEFEQFQTALVDMGKVTDQSLSMIRKNITSMPPELGDATSLVKGYYQVISAGVTKPVDALDLLTIAAKTSRAAHVDQSEVIKGLTKVMAGFEGEIRTATDASDLMFMIEKKGQTQVSELIPVIGGLAKVTKEAGGTSNEMGAGLAVITQTAGSTAEAATRYQGVLVSLMRSNETMTEAVKELGYESATTMVKELGLSETLMKLNGTSIASSEGLMKLYGRQEAMLGVSAILAEDGRAYNEALAEMEGRAGAMDKAFEDWTKTYEAVKVTFDSTLKLALIELGEELVPVAIGVMKDLTSEIRGFLDSGKIDKIGPVIEGVYDKVKKITDFALDHKDILAGGIIGHFMFGPTGMIILAGVGAAKELMEDLFAVMSKGMEDGSKNLKDNIMLAERQIAQLEKVKERYEDEIKYMKEGSKEYEATKKSLEMVNEKLKDQNTILKTNKKSLEDINKTHRDTAEVYEEEKKKLKKLTDDTVYYYGKELDEYQDMLAGKTKADKVLTKEEQKELEKREKAQAKTLERIEDLYVKESQTEIEQIKYKYRQFREEINNNVYDEERRKEAITRLAWAEASEINETYFSRKSTIKEYYKDMKQKAEDAAAHARQVEENRKQANTSLYNSLKTEAQGYYDFEMARIDAQALKFKEAGADEVNIGRWKAEEIKKLNREMLKESDDYVAGIKDGLERSKEDWTSWGQWASDATLSLAKTARSTMSDVLFDAVKGDLKSFSDYWDSIWNSLLRTVTNRIADMAVTAAIDWVETLFFAKGAWNVGDQRTASNATGKNKDTIPAMLSEGEMVLPEDEADKLRNLVTQSTGRTGLSALSEVLTGATGAFARGAISKFLKTTALAGVKMVQGQINIDDYAKALPSILGYSAISGGLPAYALAKFGITSDQGAFGAKAGGLLTSVATGSWLLGVIGKIAGGYIAEQLSDLFNLRTWQGVKGLEALADKYEVRGGMSAEQLGRFMNAAAGLATSRVSAPTSEDYLAMLGSYSDSPYYTTPEGAMELYGYRKGGLVKSPGLIGEYGDEWAVPTYEPERSQFLRDIGMTSDNLTDIMAKALSNISIGSQGDLNVKIDLQIGDVALDSIFVSQAISNGEFLEIIKRNVNG